MPVTQIEVPRARRQARLAVAVAFFVSGAGFANWAARIPAVKDQLGLSTGALGIALLGLAAGALAAMPLSGLLLVRYSSRTVTRASLGLFCTVLALPALAPSLPLLVAALVTLGIGGGALDVSMNAQAVAVERGYGRPLLAGFHGLWSLGTLAGALTGGLAAGAGLAPRAHLALAGALLLVVGLPATRRLLPAGDDLAPSAPAALPAPAAPAPAPAPDPGSAPTPRAAPFGFPGPLHLLVLLGAIAFCGLLSEGAVYDWSAVYLRDSLGSSEGLAVSAYAAFTFAMTAGRLVGDRLRLRFGSRGLLGAAALVAAGGLGAGLALRDVPAAVAGFGLLGAGLSCVVPIVFSAAGGTSGLRPGPAIAAVSTVGYLGFIAGPPLIGALAELSTLPAALTLVVALTAAVALMARRLPALD